MEGFVQMPRARNEKRGGTVKEGHFTGTAMQCEVALVHSLCTSVKAAYKHAHSHFCESWGNRNRDVATDQEKKKGWVTGH